MSFFNVLMLKVFHLVGEIVKDDQEINDNNKNSDSTRQHVHCPMGVTDGVFMKIRANADYLHLGGF